MPSLIEIHREFCWVTCIANRHRVRHTVQARTTELSEIIIRTLLNETHLQQCQADHCRQATMMHLLSKPRRVTDSGRSLSFVRLRRVRWA